jgi:hypothetical protein
VKTVNLASGRGSHFRIREKMGEMGKMDENGGASFETRPIGRSSG